jgi:cellulose synthase/poly-beta-1,6-N-acetylglucosamine synthase-like glycosyltransferase
MLTFSLIVATLGRTRELENLFKSLASQAYPNLECIIVDQNPDRRVKEIVDGRGHHLGLSDVNFAPNPAYYSVRDVLRANSLRPRKSGF